jgi:hypothetical protein
MGRKIIVKLIIPNWASLSILALVTVGACTPTVKIETPREPITINLNIKLDADVRLKLKESADKNITNNPEIF